MAAALVPAQPPVSSFTGGFRPLVLLGLLSQGTINTGIATAPIYRGTAVIYGALTLLLFWGALLAVRPRRRPTREDGVMLALLVGYGLLAYLLRPWWVPGIFPG
jgi:hypothetical protein